MISPTRKFEVLPYLTSGISLVNQQEEKNNKPNKKLYQIPNISEKKDMYYIKITQSKEEPINLNEIQILEEESGLNVISNVVIIPSSFEPDPMTYNTSKLMSSYIVSRSNDRNEESYNPLQLKKASKDYIL